jgi:hypothetical protein
MLSEENFLLYAMNNYKNSQCSSIEEFNDDLKKIKHIKKLLNRMLAGEEVNLRLVINHIVIFFNVFDVIAGSRMLFFKTEQDKWVLLSTFLSFLNFMPEYNHDINLSSRDIGVDDKLLRRLELL